SRNRWTSMRSSPPSTAASAPRRRPSRCAEDPASRGVHACARRTHAHAGAPPPDGLASCRASGQDLDFRGPMPLARPTLAALAILLVVPGCDLLDPKDSGGGPSPSD